MSFPRYPEYKDSGVEWLGEVPAHWWPTRVKRILAKMGSGGTPATDSAEFWSDQDGHAWVAIGDMSDRDMVNETCKRLTPAGVESKGLSIWPAGTLLFSMYASLGHVAVLGIPAATNQAILALLPNSECNQGYLKRWFEFLKPHLAQEASSNTQDNLNAEKVRNLPALALPMQEQERISAFLDHETAKIDALVAEQEKLIALLKEKRQAVISHAVTKGLNPDAPMKDSGIEWLEEVPAHWEVGPLKRFSDVVDCKHHTVQFLDEGLPIVSIRELRDDRIALTDAKLTSRDEWDFLRDGRVPQRGDMIFCRNASVGAVGYVDFDDPFCMGQDVCLIRSNSKSRFMHFQLTSNFVRNQIEAFLVGATIRRANVEEIRGLLVTAPPLGEQEAIAAFLMDEIAKLDALSANAEKAIGLLKERRSALISAAVTGKIDVRGLVAEREAA